MKKQIFNFKTIGLFLIVFLLTEVMQAQNIVTIFGQEKIEKTDEGEVFHTFRDGLLLSGSVNPGVLFNGQDMIAWLYATGNFKTPQNGQAINFEYPNDQPRELNEEDLERMQRRGIDTKMLTIPRWTWAEISADSADLFRDAAMRSAYLYMNYNSPKEEIALLETTGGTRTYVNGFPHEGDHYDFGYTLIPLKLKKGLNEVIHTPGRFGRVAAKLVKPDKPVMFTKRDMTVPDLIIGESDAKWAAIRVINASDKPLKGMTIRATLSTGQTTSYATDDIMPLQVRKVKYQLPSAGNNREESVTAKLELLDKGGKLIDQTEITLRQVLPSVHHERTFVSNIDGSVQYYSVAPAIRNSVGETKAMVLTVHGAGVEARNQARAYKSKDWTDIVAATNRRPYGFNWEVWGRLDGLEVLEEAKRIYSPDKSRIYLTGHSMGGHGTWILGTTYPDKFAAIAPCAGYPDISTYGRGGEADKMHSGNPHYEAFVRGGNVGRTLSLLQNLKQSGVYIFHGDADRVVPTAQARFMREKLGQFHPDFCYYEYPGGEHWFGDISVDWHPIFEFFSRHSIPQNKEVLEIDFNTASPGVSASDYWIRVEQQVKPGNFTNVVAKKDNDTIKIEKAENVALLVLDVPSLTFESSLAAIRIGNQILNVNTGKQAILSFKNNSWNVVDKIDTKQKYSGRYGDFKYAYNHKVVLVYGTKGNKNENEWNKSKALFDAETFYYRANGSIEVIPDTEYSLDKYHERSVVLYGNRDNNRAWPLLLSNCPVQVANGTITAGTKTYTGNDLGVYFIYPHPASDTATVGVVGGTGDAGMRATSNNNYISGITGFPDLMVFRADMLKDGLSGMEAAGYFDNDWSLNNMDF